MAPSAPIINTIIDALVAGVSTITAGAVYNYSMGDVSGEMKTLEEIIAIGAALPAVYILTQEEAYGEQFANDGRSTATLHFFILVEDATTPRKTLMKTKQDICIWIEKNIDAMRATIQGFDEIEPTMLDMSQPYQVLGINIEPVNRPNAVGRLDVDIKYKYTLANGG